MGSARFQAQYHNNPIDPEAEVIAVIERLYPDLELPPQRTLQEHAADAVGAILCVLDLPDVKLALRVQGAA